MGKFDTLDYLQALKILVPYKDKLSQIYEAYLAGVFENDSIDYKDFYSVLTYYKESIAYKKFDVYELTLQIKMELKELDIKDYRFEDIDMIEKSYGEEIPHEFDGRWNLEDVYKYLLNLAYSYKEVVMENSIINGEILGIINCFIFRV